MTYKKNIVTFLILLLAAFTLLSCGSSKNIAKKRQTPHVLSVEEQRRFTYFFYEALRQKELENYDLALELLTKCYHIDNLDAALMYEFSNVYLSVGNIHYAISYLTHAVRLDDRNFWYQTNLANLYLAIGDLRTATDIFEFSAKQFPERNEINYYLVELYLRQRRFSDAINVLNRIEKKHGIREDISLEKWRIYSNLGETRKAMRELNALIAAFPQNMQYRIMKGNMYLENRNFARALQQYNYVLAQEPDNSFARLSLIEFYQRTGEHEKAAVEMEHVLRNKNIDIEAKISILDRYLNSLREEEKWGEKTISLFETLLEAHPNTVRVHHFYALHLAALEKLDDALGQYEAMLEIDPENMAALLGIVLIKAEQKNMEELIEATNRAIKVFPELPGWYFYQGIAFFQLKKYDDAIVAFQKGLSFVPETDRKLRSEFHGQLGDTYFKMKERELAFESYQRALEYNPMNAHVLNNYAYYLAISRQDLLKAERMAKQALALMPYNSAVLDTYAWVLFQQGFFNLARRYIEKAIKHCEENNYVIIEHYGDVLYKTGEKERALIMWKKSLELGNESETLPLKIEQETFIADEIN